MFNPSRLTLARRRRGLTKSKLAKAVGVTPLTISRYENGDSEPSGSTLAALAKVLGFPISFFTGADLEIPSVEGVSFRALTRMTASQRDAALGAASFAIALSGYLDDRFDLPAPDVARVERGVLDPEAAAEMVRVQWGLGTHPLPNLVHLLESHGVRVFSLVEECRELDALSFWHRRTPFVLLNTMKTPEHSRFDAAHELGHLVMHRDHSSPRGREEELEAHAFAAALLMPRSDVVAHATRFPGFQDLCTMKRRWGVSVAALAYRLHKLDLISDWHYRELCIEISRYGRNREPDSIQPELSQLLGKTLAALRDEGTGRTSIARELDLPPSELDALVFGLAMTAIEGDGTTVEKEPPLLRLL
jgi:Zn-dependent peptidase ImmA (M78 family)/transcriptional regulator with XRE-family HTH domain